MVQSVNYFGNLGAECHLLKIGCSESSFTKYWGCQCNLPFILLSLICNSFVGYVSHTLAVYKFLFEKELNGAISQNIPKIHYIHMSFLNESIGSKSL
jgi:hypothetical protein